MVDETGRTDAPTPPPPPVTAPVVENNSGTGGPAPEEIKGWNWGAFWLSWIWGIGNNVWIAFVVIVLGLIWNIVLGVKGNEWAWQNRRFESIQQFKDTQAAWSKWGWILFIVSLIGFVLMMVLFGGLAALGAASDL